MFKHCTQLLTLCIVFDYCGAHDNKKHHCCVCVYVQRNNYVTQQTCSESRFGWRLLHDHGEGGRGWR